MRDARQPPRNGRVAFAECWAGASPCSHCAKMAVMSRLRLREVRLENYKAFRDFRLQLAGSTYLVGPNNAGKSTLISAIQAGAYLLRVAASRKPNLRRRDEGRNVVAYSFTSERAGIQEANIRHEFMPETTKLHLAFSNGAKLTVVWPAPQYEDDEELAEEVIHEVEPYFYLTRRDRPQPLSPSQVTESFPRLGTIPLLGPLEDREQVLSEGWVREQVESPLSSRHFRNQLYLLQIERLVVRGGLPDPGTFDDFLGYIAPWLNEIAIVKPKSRFGALPDLDVYYTESGRPRPKELVWAGDGIQVWMQLLFHMFRLQQADVIVLDEPELFLHPDLQRRLVRLLSASGAQTITTTHSPEVLGEAERELYVYIDKNSTRSLRGPDESFLAQAAVGLGSRFDISLARAQQAKVVFCVEGDDMRVLTHIANGLHLRLLANEVGVAILPLGGFDNWERVEPFKWLLDKFLRRSVKVMVTLDRDYRSDSHIAEVEDALGNAGITTHVWRRKELESYLIEPDVLALLSGAPQGWVEETLMTEADQLRSYVKVQCSESERRRHVAARRNPVSELVELEKDLEDTWTKPTNLWHRCPAKSSKTHKGLLPAFNDRSVESGYKSVSLVALARAVGRENLDPELIEWLTKVEESIRTMAFDPNQR